MDKLGSNPHQSSMEEEESDTEGKKAADYAALAASLQPQKHSSSDLA